MFYCLALVSNWDQRMGARWGGGAESRVRVEQTAVFTHGYFRLNPDKVEITDRHIQLQTAVPADGKSISVFPLTGTYCGQTHSR